MKAAAISIINLANNTTLKELLAAEWVRSAAGRSRLQAKALFLESSLPCGQGQMQMVVSVGWARRRTSIVVRTADRKDAGRAWL